MKITIRTIRHGQETLFLLSNNRTFIYRIMYEPDAIIYDVDTSGIAGYSDPEFSYPAKSWVGELFLKASEVMARIGDLR